MLWELNAIKNHFKKTETLLSSKLTYSTGIHHIWVSTIKLTICFKSSKTNPFRQELNWPQFSQRMWLMYLRTSNIQFTGKGPVTNMISGLTHWPIRKRQEASYGSHWTYRYKFIGCFSPAPFKVFILGKGRPISRKKGGKKDLNISPMVYLITNTWINTACAKTHGWMQSGCGWR